MKEKLMELGLIKYEAEAYHTLLLIGQAPASEISKMYNIPQGRIYGILDSLEKKGFCSVSLGKVKRYKAVHPKTTFTSLISKRNEEIENLKVLQTELESCYNVENDTNPADYIQVLTSKQGQVEKFDDIIQLSTKTLYSFNKKPYATGFKRNSKELKHASSPLLDTIKRGTKVRALFEAEEGDNKIAFLDMVDYYKSIGEEVLICKELPLKMLLADDKIAMVSLRNTGINNFKLTSMVIEHSDLTNAMNELFDMYWSKGKTINDYYNT